MNRSRIAATSIACLLLSTALVLAQPSNVPVLAATTSGKIQGYRDQGINVFKDIPYGDNTAKRRFKAPLPAPRWTGVRDCMRFGAMAPQQARPKPGRLQQQIRESEDCLRVNVWTPELRDGVKRPVMVWFHGGGYSNGTGNDDLYDGVRLCKRGDVVVVTVNHRVNLFGFLYLAEIGGDEFAESGNAGMLDCVLALKWVRNNITEFGGDTSNVTIFGQSGGGAKCATLMAMPSAQGLFHRVITESGQQVTGRTREHATATAHEVIQALGLTPDHIAEIKKMPMTKLIASMRNLYYGPVTDGVVLPRDPFSPDAPPLSSHIPMMMGNTHDETTTLIGGGDSTLFTLTWEALPGKIRQYVPQFIGDLRPDSIVAFYRRLYPQYRPSDVFFSATTAARSWRGLIIESERRAAQHAAPTYVFQFDWQSPVDGGKWKASHAMEIPFVFDNVGYGKSIVGSGAAQQTMADMMSDTWIAFARTGNPNTDRLPAWPPFTLEARPTMIFDLTPRVVNDPRGEERRLFAPIPYVQPGT
jgi:para-nitrobenzyl esterase